MPHAVGDPPGNPRDAGEFFSQVSALMAGATLTIVPVLIVYFSAQKYFIQASP